MSNNKNTLSIKAISAACGVLPQTIRTWEKRYQAFNPTRTDGGQRLYSDLDLNRAKLIVTLLEKGFTISKIAILTKEQLQEQVESINSDDSGIKTNTLHNIGMKKLLNYLLHYDINSVASEMQHLRMSTGAKDFVFQIVLPVMSEIGLLVAKGKYSVTQEHIISAIVRYQLGQIQLPNVESTFGKIALATPEGNIHELSIIIADIICRSNRYNTSYLGAAHPAESLAEAVNALKCQTIVLGTVTSDQWDYTKQIVPYLESVDKCLKIKVDIMLGGGLDIKLPKFKMISKVTVIKSFDDFDKILLALD